MILTIRTYSNRIASDRFVSVVTGAYMAHLNIYLSKERERWLRQHLDDIAQADNRSLSYIVEEALVQFVQRKGKEVPNEKRKDHRSRATR